MEKTQLDSKWQPKDSLAVVVKVEEIVGSLEGQTKEMGEKWNN